MQLFSRRNTLRLITGIPLIAFVVNSQAIERTNDTFNRSFLIGKSDFDISRFSKPNQALPGTYRVDVFVNDNKVGREEVTFHAVGVDQPILPCFTHEQLERFGAESSKLASQFGPEDDCRRIEDWVAQAQMYYSPSDLRLDLSLPQAALRRSARGYVDPKYWDSGVTAGFIGYNFNTFQAKNEHSGPSTTTRSSYLGLNAGFNLGDWQFRHTSSANWRTGSERRWQTTANYVQRALPQWRSQITLGDSTTSGELFDSIGYRGGRLASDDRMLPDSLRGYAPVVRGVANTNALVEIRQNGILLYQDTVPAGPYVIDDLYPSGYGGDLKVKVNEADGKVQHFSVSYASVAQLMRPETWRYSVITGQVREQLLDTEPTFIEGTLQYGFNNLLTGYTGAQASSKYQAALVGGAFNTRYGAFSVDLTHSNSDLPISGTLSGHSLKLGYSKLLPETGTNLSIAAYRYSTSGYLGLREALTAYDYENTGSVNITDYNPARETPLSGLRDLRGTSQAREYAKSVALRRQRSSFELSVTQPLPSGSLYLSGSTRDYWGTKGRDTQFRAGYNNSWRGVNYGISAARNRNAIGRAETEYFLTLSMPIGGGRHAPTLSSSMSHNDSGYRTAQVGLSGTAGADNSFAYGISSSRDSRDGGSASGNAQYRLPQATVTGAYSQGHGYRQASAGLSGTLVGHSGGITLSPQYGETMGLIEAKGAEGARITNVPGARIDRHGYAVVPYLSAYSLNTVGLDPHGTSVDVELLNTSLQVAPYAGAIVKLAFPTVSGRSLMIHAVDARGLPLPFGAEVLDEKGNSIGVVGQASRLYVRGVFEKGSLLVRWGNSPDQQCHLNYRLPPRKDDKSLQSIEATCEALYNSVAALARAQL